MTIWKTAEPHYDLKEHGQIGTWVEVDIKILDTFTGKAVTIKESLPYIHEEDPTKPRFYNWEDGNQSCDCVRYSYHFPDDEEHYNCGDERFLIEISNPVDGEVIYSEIIKEVL